MAPLQQNWSYDADGSIVTQGAAWPSLTFRILRLERIDVGPKQAVGIIEIDGFGELDFEYVRSTNKWEPLIGARSTRDKSTGASICCARISDELADDLRLAVEARLAAEDGGDCGA